MGDVNEAPLRLIGMGGTIAFGASENGAVPRLDAQQLADSVGLARPPEVLELSRVSSIATSTADLLRLARAVHRAAADGVAGVVVTHGTDTLEETAYFLALTVPRGRIPVVLTGAMRHADQPGHDGVANLRAAVAVAAAPGAADAGPVVVLNDEIHAARLVTKRHTTNPAAFASSPGCLGHVTEDTAALTLLPAYQDHLGLPDTEDLPRVDLLTAHLGMDGGSLQAVLDRAPDGLVIQGFGGGHLAPRALEALDDVLAAGIPVVMASRAGSGSTLARTYAVPGTEVDLQRRGVVMAGDLAGVKVRLRLAVGLALGRPVPRLFPVRP